MTDQHTQWKRMNDALDRGDFPAARNAFDRMSSEEMDLMRETLGEHIARKLVGIRQRRRGPKKGRVVVINGIMGAELYSIDRTGDVDHVWINIGRLFLGQLARLELDENGQQIKKKYRIEPRRLHKTYLPLALELERSWHVLQFPFDWRLNIDIEAQRLASDIKTWAQGEPVHIVAHSMGGLLSRRFIQKFPSVWQSMADPDGLRRGGRLIMLGTPNKGSFVIPSMLTGKEKVVKILSFIDFGESKRRFLRNASSFPGGYQMMPSPVVDLQDDHLDLYRKSTWGRYRVIGAHLAMAKRFQTDLDSAISPERLIYVAGYGVRTQQRIEVKKAGKFRYEVSSEGDGRVPHSLGLLDAVTVQWVQEKHGDLPLNDRVMRGMNDLLELGRTRELEATRPALRGVATEPVWVEADDLVELSAEEEAAAKAFGARLRGARSRGAGSVAVSAKTRMLLDGMLDDYLATAGPAGPSEPGSRARKSRRAKPELKIEVFWGDIRQVRGDIYCVGHYEGVLPQRAEYALDTVVSRSKRLEEMVLRTHTQRGVLRGGLGEVNLYPWARQYKPPRSVAVAGMGRMGQFSEASLRSLARHLCWAVATLPNAETICTVLIGSGEGNLSIGQSVRGMIQGMADALEAGLHSHVWRLRFVELFRDKALAVKDELKRVAEVEDRLKLRLGRKVRRGRGGRLTVEDSLALATAALIDSRTSRSRSVGVATSTILRRIPAEANIRDSVDEVLEDFAKPRQKVEDIASSIRIVLEPEEARKNEPNYLSFWRAEGATHVTALTNTAVKPERISRADPSLLNQLSVKLQDPDQEEVTRFGSLLHRLVVPRDFADVLERAAAMVVEVDRPMSTVNWEMLTVDPNSGVPLDCLALKYPFARQLRTEYSPPPSGEPVSSGGLRALVIGDPGDPEEGEHLPGAREEAQCVDALLRKLGVDVTLRLGAPIQDGRGPVSGVEPASRLEILELLQTQRFDILHYAGHGDFQDDEGVRSGWLFKEGMLTAAELETVDSPPRLVVANACLSARTSTRLRSGERVAPEYGDAGLLPSLVDEFLRRGVRDYIGTAWEVNDEGAIRFATSLYRSLKLSKRGAGQTLGDALLQARRDLFKEAQRYGTLWAAYQYYGDPTVEL